MITARHFSWSWQGREVGLAVDEAGEGPLVVLLPALSSISSRGEMRPLMERLARDFRVVAAGHAATYVLHHAARHPGALDRIVLVAPTWRGPLPTMAGGDRPFFAKIRRAVEAPLIGPLLYRLNVNDFVVSKMVAGHVYSDPAALSGARMADKRKVVAAPGARFASAAFVTGGLDRVATRDDFLALAVRTASPLLLVYGAETPPRSRAEMEALAALPRVRTERLPRGKLSVHEEFSDDVYAAIKPFLAE